MQFWQATFVTELVVCVILLIIVVVVSIVVGPACANEFERTLMYVVVVPSWAVNVTVDKP